MFIDNVEQTFDIAARTECSIFVLSSDADKTQFHQQAQAKQALILEPSSDSKSQSITVDQVREFMNFSNNRETADRFFVIQPADAMNEAAQNAFLKTFEEPKPFCHFVLITTQPTLLLPTILSRAQIFFLRAENCLQTAPVAPPQILALAKRLISASSKELPQIAVEITKAKNQSRETSLLIVSTAIELLYKSYFKTKNPRFLSKLPQFITLYENISRNGHIKLHLVADLL